MPDTSANQAAYPQNPSQRPGLGFPIARLGAIFSLSCGAILDLGICRYAGKGQSELGLLRRLMKSFRPGDVMLADRLMCSWAEMTALHSLGIDCVVRHSAIRKIDFRCGQRLGKDDQIVSWPKRYPRCREDRGFAAELPNRPNRFEPRFRKQPIERRNYFIVSRDQAKQQMLKRFKKN